MIVIKVKFKSGATVTIRAADETEAELLLNRFSGMGVSTVAKTYL